MTPVRLLLAALVVLLLVAAAMLFRDPDRSPEAARHPGSTASGEPNIHRGEDAGPGVPAAERGERPDGEPGGSARRPLPERLAAVLGDAGTLPARHRIEWLREHGGDFNDAERSAVLDLLASGHVPAGLTPGEWHWIVDQLLTELRLGATDPRALTRELHGIFSDRSLDPVVRDYALQHLGHLGREGGDAAIVRAAALSGLAETATPMVGTALLVLHYEPSDPGVPEPAFEPGRRALDAPDPGALALDLLGNEGASAAARATAFQVAAQRRAEGTLPAAAEVLRSDAPLLLRVAAAGAVAEAGSRADLPVLEELPAASPVLRRAVNAGIRKLAAR